MKKIFYLVALIAATMFCSCEKKNNNNEVTTDKEALLKQAVVGQVNDHITVVYTQLANATIALLKDCEEMYDAADQTSLAAAQKKAAEDWVASRKYWELSESFLFGPVNYYNVDPHIDSWPLDKDKLESLLARINKGEEVGIEDLTYGTAGFHSLEYMLYDPTNNDKNNVRLHNLNYTPAELQYILAVAKDLAAQTALLQACWVGVDKLTDDQKEMLEELELDKPEFNDPFRYALTDLNSSKYKTYQSAAEEIIQGCIDIADEVGNTKMGTPANAADEADRNYIESPYALNSIVDFQDNIISIRNSYCGVNDNYSISSYINSVNPTLDAEVRAAIEASITAIAAIPEPFINNAKGPETKAAVAATGTTLKKALEKVNEVITAID